jgi:hypothetical protein
VLYDVDDSHVKGLRPRRGQAPDERARDFERNWSGYAALFDYTDRFAANVPSAGPVIAWLAPFLPAVLEPAAPRPRALALRS